MGAAAPRAIFPGAHAPRVVGLASSPETGTLRLSRGRVHLKMGPLDADSSPNGCEAKGRAFRIFFPLSSSFLPYVFQCRG